MRSSPADALHTVKRAFSWAIGRGGAIWLALVATVTLTTSAAAGDDYARVSYWRDGTPAAAYDMGIRSRLSGGRVASQPVWRLVRGRDVAGQPLVVPGQFSIFGVTPAQASYTDLWRVVDVEVPAAYTANSARSAADLVRDGYPQSVTTQLVDCPLVDSANDRLPDTAAVPKQGWVSGKPVWYFDFGAASATTGTIWQFTQAAPGAAHPTSIPGQQPLTDASLAIFRRLVWVTVPASFPAGAVHTVAELRSLNYPTHVTNLIENLPVDSSATGASTDFFPRTHSVAATNVVVGLFALVFLVVAGYILRGSRG
ncbi:MAG TPA: hypothetical protein VMV93_14765 [Chloroflexota bacterium]|nr:hypothetical protein [Chloroflexota bacterium]